MHPKNHPRKRRKYDEDVKAEVLRMIKNGHSISTVFQSPGIGEYSIYRWKSKGKTTVKQSVKTDKEC